MADADTELASAAVVAAFLAAKILSSAFGATGRLFTAMSEPRRPEFSGLRQSDALFAGFGPFAPSPSKFPRAGCTKCLTTPK